MKTNKLLLSEAKHDIESDVWCDLVKSYEPLIEKWVRRFDSLDTDVSDISQDVLCALVTELPKFEHNGRTGAFRSWLRNITVNRIRQHWQRQKQFRTEQGLETAQALQELADPRSELADRWDREHDQHVFEQILAKVETEFGETTIKAFRQFVLGGEDASKVADDLGVSTNLIYKYKFRVVNRLKELGASLESLGLNSIIGNFPEDSGSMLTKPNNVA